jgi:hypothetical protein
MTCCGVLTQIHNVFFVGIQDFLLNTGSWHANGLRVFSPNLLLSRVEASSPPLPQPEESPLVFDLDVHVFKL